MTQEQGLWSLNWSRRALPGFPARRRVMLVVLVVALLAVVWRALDRQLTDIDRIQAWGNELSVRELEIPAHRGEIRDRNGAPLAISTPVDSVAADPRLLPPDAPIIVPLAEILGMKPDALRKLLGEHKERGFVYLKRGARPEVGQKIQALLKDYKTQFRAEVKKAGRKKVIEDTSGARGIRVDREYRRYYPDGEVAVHVVGLTDIDDKGLEGMEVSHEAKLSGKPGLRRVLQDGRGQVVEEVEGLRDPVDGQSLMLSLDRRLQYLTYVELMRAVKDHRAKAGTAVILDAQTGEVLAMANQPSYNPNDRPDFRPELQRNRAVTDLMEPGSTMKPLVVAAALELGKVNPRTPVNTSPGQLQIGEHTVKDVHNYGQLDVTGVITKSSNVGVTKLALDMDPGYLWRNFRAFGVGMPTESKLKGEVLGVLPDHKRWSRFDQAVHSFGYGLSMNALQLARAYTVLASDGVRRPVSMFKQNEVPAGERVIKPATAQALRTMMETVVSTQGTAIKASVPGYRVAGKTGTAKKSIHGVYAPGHYQSVFAGMVPASRPRLVMVVMIDEPQGSAYYGGLVAAPVFSRVMSEALRLLNIPPDAEAPTPEPRLAARAVTHR